MGRDAGRKALNLLHHGRLEARRGRHGTFRTAGAPPGRALSGGVEPPYGGREARRRRRGPLYRLPGGTLLAGVRGARGPVPVTGRTQRRGGSGAGVRYAGSRCLGSQGVALLRAAATLCFDSLHIGLLHVGLPYVDSLHIGSLHIGSLHIDSLHIDSRYVDLWRGLGRARHGHRAGDHVALGGLGARAVCEGDAEQQHAEGQQPQQRTAGSTGPHYAPG
ncbi:hypothetical protein ABZ626_35755 [Streptomyces longispororuber]|uniref:hypothetical protein n=1 Tax=Streptomyces longispororuber TaxID=68230 RepID=UPI0033F6D18B